MLHKSKLQLLLICGLILSMALFTACSSEKAVQANAPVGSSPSVGGSTSNASSEIAESLSSLQTSSLVSSNVPQVSSAVTASSPSSTASHQSPVTSKPSTSSGGTKTSSAKVTSQAPASVTPAPKPASTAPASKPVSTAPAPASDSVSGKYHGATYGAESQSQYNEILSYAGKVTSSGSYAKNHAANQEYKDQFEAAYGVPYSEDADVITSIIGCFQNSSASGSTGNAYIAYTQGSSNCGDDAKAIQAALNVAGYNCKLVWGTNARGQSHMWTSVYFGGSWHEWGTGKFSSGTPAGYSASGSGYNY